MNRWPTSPRVVVMNCLRHGPRHAREIFDLGDDHGLSRPSLEVAASKLGVLRSAGGMWELPGNLLAIWWGRHPAPVVGGVRDCI
jgi:hypothetical protein